MKAILTTITLLALFSCSSSDRVQYSAPVPVTPIPTEQLSSVASDSTKAGSYDLALRRAQNLCNKWHAAPSIVSKQVRYNGQITEDANTAINTAEKIANAAGVLLPGIRNDDAYETTIFYKCY